MTQTLGFLGRRGGGCGHGFTLPFCAGIHHLWPGLIFLIFITLRTSGKASFFIFSLQSLEIWIYPIKGIICHRYTWCQLAFYNLRRGLRDFILFDNIGLIGFFGEALVDSEHLFVLEACLWNLIHFYFDEWTRQCPGLGFRKNFKRK